LTQWPQLMPLIFTVLCIVAESKARSSRGKG
jgi:hypothetical protein